MLCLLVCMSGKQTLRFTLFQSHRSRVACNAVWCGKQRWQISAHNRVKSCVGVTLCVCGVCGVAPCRGEAIVVFGLTLVMFLFSLMSDSCSSCPVS